MDSTWKLHHVGIPVRDLDRSLEDYKSLGMATFQPEFQIDSSRVEEYLVYGKTPDPVVKTRGVLGQMGPLGIELLQPVQGETVHKELLESTGEGIGHVAYTVDDLEEETAKLVERGFPVILSIRPAGQTKRSAVYIDTRSKFSNLIIELMQAR
ncbi:MAG: VOC family protein [Pseudomonadales bacterium]|mgnify:CR=1 FL=1|jgi:catechol 2,3-dioxygenase-like lactoylglutathione lyase family enzyme|nr:VOC family protein [Pseudomonadales bacterium]MDP7598149.1 VOC family protein [Pseudomonadales bacterium]|tara:strand:+ start:118 stop:576 length:459 start_codon:yes stop_codon:yes gene_type:complete